MGHLVCYEAMPPASLSREIESEKSALLTKYCRLLNDLLLSLGYIEDTGKIFSPFSEAQSFISSRLGSQVAIPADYSRGLINNIA